MDVVGQVRVEAARRDGERVAAAQHRRQRLGRHPQQVHVGVVRASCSRQRSARGCAGRRRLAERRRPRFAHRRRQRAQLRDLHEVVRADREAGDGHRRAGRRAGRRPLRAPTRLPAPPSRPLSWCATASTLERPARSPARAISQAPAAAAIGSRARDVFRPVVRPDRNPLVGLPHEPLLVVGALQVLGDGCLPRGGADGRELVEHERQTQLLPDAPARHAALVLPTCLDVPGSVASCQLSYPSWTTSTRNPNGRVLARLRVHEEHRGPARPLPRRLVDDVEALAPSCRRTPAGCRTRGTRRARSRRGRRSGRSASAPASRAVSGSSNWTRFGPSPIAQEHFAHLVAAEHVLAVDLGEAEQLGRRPPGRRGSPAFTAIATWSTQAMAGTPATAAVNDSCGSGSGLDKGSSFSSPKFYCVAVLAAKCHGPARSGPLPPCWPIVGLPWGPLAALSPPSFLRFCRPPSPPPSRDASSSRAPESRLPTPRSRCSAVLALARTDADGLLHLDARPAAPLRGARDPARRAVHAPGPGAAAAQARGPSPSRWRRWCRRRSASPPARRRGSRRRPAAG